MPENNKAACTDLDLYEDVDFCPGDSSTPGTRNHFYFTKKGKCQSIPKPKGYNATKMEEVAVISDNITLQENETWKKVVLVPLEAEVTTQSQGSYGSKTFQNKVILVLPGSAKKNTGLIAMLNNDDVLISVPMANGQHRLFGNADYQTQVQLSQAQGKTTTDPNTTTIEVTVDDRFPAPYYEGTLLTEEGTISGINDELVTAGG